MADDSDIDSLLAVDEHVLDRVRGGRLAPSPGRVEQAARVRHIIHQGEDFAVAECETAGGLRFTVCGAAAPGELARGVVYTFLGRWRAHEKHGDQVVFDAFARDFPESRQGVVAFVKTVLKGTGFGEGSAGKLFDAWGRGCLPRMAGDPDGAAAAASAPVEACRRAAAVLAAQRDSLAAWVGLHTLLSGHRFPRKAYAAALEALGPGAALIVRKDPFRLLAERVPGASFRRVDSLYRELALPPQEPERCAWAAWDAASSGRDGHTWLRRFQAADMVRDRLGPDSRPDAALDEAVRRGMLCERRVPGEGSFLSTPARAEAEADILAAVLRLNAGPPSLWPDPDSLPLLTEHQKSQLAAALAAPLGVLAGGPGTGKSTVSMAVVAACRAAGLEVGVTAPTGRAAVRDTEIMQSPPWRMAAAAHTTHQLLGVAVGTGRLGEDGWVFRHGPEQPLPYDVVVADECFPADALVDVPGGRKRIADIVPGDRILNASGVDVVVAARKTEVERVVKLQVGGQTIFCSPRHRWFTARGVVFASGLEPGDSLIRTAPALRLLRQGHRACGFLSGVAAVLHSLLHMGVAAGQAGQASLRSIAAQDREGEKGMAPLWRSQGGGGDRTYPGTEPGHEARGAGEDLCVSETQGAQTSDPRRKRSRAFQNGGFPDGCAGRTVGTACGSSGTAQDSWLSDSLQAGCGGPGTESRHRAGRDIPSCPGSQGGRPEEDGETCFARLDGVEVLEQRDPELDRFRDASGKLYFHDIQAARHPSFSIEGLLTHNCSMTDASLMASLLRACAAGTHVLLVGDPGQLPPVGHGAPLRDLIASGVVPCGRLDLPHRSSGRIAVACGQLRRWRPESGTAPFETSPRIDLKAGENLRHQHAASADEALGVLRSFLELLGRSGFDPVWDVQVLVAVNADTDLARDAVNAALRSWLNPGGARAPGNPFAVGDKVVCRRNGLRAVAAAPADAARHGDASAWTLPRGEGGEPERVYVANGDIGRVLAVSGPHCVALFAAPPRCVRFPVQSADEEASPGEESCLFELAYAGTVHMFQGSEQRCCVVMIDPSPRAARVASRQWVYTALSRGRELCLTVGDLAVLHRWCGRNALVDRQTMLRDMLKAALSG